MGQQGCPFGGEHHRGLRGRIRDLHPTTTACCRSAREDRLLILLAEESELIRLPALALASGIASMLASWPLRAGGKQIVP